MIDSSASQPGPGTPSITRRLIIVAVPLLLYFTMVGRSKLLNDADTFWHIAVGRVVLDSGFIHEDHFSFTRHGQHWLANQWLAECALAIADALGGLDGVLVLTVTILTATYLGLSYRWLVQGFDPLLTLAFVALVISASAYTLNARPHIASIGLLGLTFAMLRDVEDGRRRILHLLWLIPLFVLWSNLHGAVLGGLGTVALVAAAWTALQFLEVLSNLLGDCPLLRSLRSKRGLSPSRRALQRLLHKASPIATVRDACLLWFAVIACALALLITPYGLGSLEAWQKIMSMSLPDLIVEHAPLHPGSPQGNLAILLCIIYVAIFAATPRAWLRPTYWMPLVWFLLTCQRIRHAPLMAIVAGIALADLLPQSRLAAWLMRRRFLRPNLAPVPAPPGTVPFSGVLAAKGDCPPPPPPRRRFWPSLLFSRKASHFAPAAALIAAVTLIMTAPLFGAAIWLQHVGSLPLIGARWARPPARVWPEALLEPITSYAAENPEATPVFNEPILGGFLIQNFPTLRVFIDGRCELYGEPFLQDFIAAWRDPSRVRQWEEQFNFDAALIEADSPLRAYFDHHDEWRLVAAAPAARFYRRETKQ